MNDEARMTNDELMTKHEARKESATPALLAVVSAVISGLRYSSFEFSSSFDIRISSFLS